MRFVKEWVKRKKSIIDALYPKFIEGGTARNHDKEKLDKILEDWEAFASYAYNKSHSTCYEFVAYQTAYLKAHYPAEFMASVLTHNKNDITKVQFFLEECRAMGVDVLGPDINESYMNFSVNKDGKIRFGLSAIKGVGEGPVSEIISSRKKEGMFNDVFDVVKRVDLRVANKRCFESLVTGGAFDTFQWPRSLYFHTEDGKVTFLEILLKFGNAFQKQKAEMSNSLFGASAADQITTVPKIPQDITEWNLMERLKREKEVTGIYLSGHPLDDFKLELKKLTKPITRLDEFKNQEVAIGGLISQINHRVSKKGTQFGFATIEDSAGQTIEFGAFGDLYLRSRHLLEKDTIVYVKGKYQPSYRDESKFEFRVQEILLLKMWLSTHKRCLPLLKT